MPCIGNWLCTWSDVERLTHICIHWQCNCNLMLSAWLQWLYITYTRWSVREEGSVSSALLTHARASLRSLRISGVGVALVYCCNYIKYNCIWMIFSTVAPCISKIHLSLHTNKCTMHLLVCNDRCIWMNLQNGPTSSALHFRLTYIQPGSRHNLPCDNKGFVMPWPVPTWILSY
jgi:hypothetical protein